MGIIEDSEALNRIVTEHVDKRVKLALDSWGKLDLAEKITSLKGALNEANVEKNTLRQDAEELKVRWRAEINGNRKRCEGIVELAEKIARAEIWEEAALYAAPERFARDELSCTMREEQCRVRDIFKSRADNEREGITGFKCNPTDHQGGGGRLDHPMG